MDPAGLGGALLRGPDEVVRAFSRAVRARLGDGAPHRRIPVAVTEDRLVGGLDLAATLAAGRRVGARGLLAEADGGTVEFPYADRAALATVMQVVQAMDDRAVRVEREGIAARHPARFALLATDESTEDDPPVHPALVDRLAFHLTLPPHQLELPPGPAPEDLAAARARLPQVEAGELAAALAGLAADLGVESIRAVVLAARCARACAALAGVDAVDEVALAVAAQLVLGPRATRVPPMDAPPPEGAESPPDEPPDDAGDGDGGDETPELPPEILREAVRVLLPRGLLTEGAQERRLAAKLAGRRGGESQGARRGRQVGTRTGDPRRGLKLDAVATLRTAAPWQRLRARQATDARGDDALRVTRDDLRVRRYRQKLGTTTIFAVDASGSLALRRLGEAKGAVELLLAESYVRRDRVALVAFRGARAEELLPPTRALARARRALAGMPGGGGTPLASGVECAARLAVQARRDGQDVTVVLLTDGRANVARDGAPGRERARADALAAARMVRGLGLRVLLIDTSLRGDPEARALADAMGGRYLFLPVLDARGIAGAVRGAQGGAA